VNVSGTVSNHTLSTAQIPSHTHSVSTGDFNPGAVPQKNGNNINASRGTNATGGGSAHNHGFSGSGSLSSVTTAINVQYVDVIIATKD
jgi:microcystin-dependent protein